MNINISLIDFLDLFNSNVQYSIPKWQRRYSWDKSTIEQLVKDLEAISKKKGDRAMHFGGTLITYSEPTPAGTTSIRNVVDGQQRLTTISILLSCIADKLEETNASLGQWTSESIRNVLLSNTLNPKEKLKLQDKDDEEYQKILAGIPGDGIVTEAWRALRKAVDEIGQDTLMKGLSRFKVISFPCESSHDPQQIFESLNATGIPLTEGEKVKNWLLMGMDRGTQERIYKNYWLPLEDSLDAADAPKRIDEFLRDFLRWKTGENVGIKHTYSNLRRWWYGSDEGGTDDRGKLCAELARLAELYGAITGANNQYTGSEVHSLLQYLRGIQYDVHRPFTLRLLNDSTKSDLTNANEEDVINVLRAMSTWLTRLWLADKPTTGLNTQFVSFAHRRDGQNIASYGDYWIEEIRKLRNTRIAVPNKKEIDGGLQTRKAYGGKASDTAKTILYALNLKFGGDTSPRVEDLSLEHIMPQTLSKEWKNYLGTGADEVHGEYINQLMNLTLVGEKYNSKISNSIYSRKRKQYIDSNVMITRELAKTYEDWRAEDMDLRLMELADMVLECWPWENVTRAKARWRIDHGDWNEEEIYAQMLLNVVSALLNLNQEENIQKLLGNQMSKDIFLSGTQPTGSGRYRPIPEHGKYVVNSHLQRSEIFKRCSDMGQRCGVKVEIEVFKGQNGDLKEWETISNDSPPNDSNPRWRIGTGEWRTEKSYKAMLPNIVSGLFDQNFSLHRSNLFGDRKTKDVTLSRQYSNETRDYRRIPKYPEYMIYVNLTARNIVKQGKRLGERCGVRVEIE